MKQNRLFLDITDLPLNQGDLFWLRDIVKNEQNRAILEHEEEIPDTCMRLLVVISYLITSLDRPIKGHFILDQ